MVWTLVPGVRSTGICLIALIHERCCRHGTYSPKGTRCTLSYRSTRSPDASNASALVRCVPSGSLTTAPTVVGTPTAAIAARTLSTVARSARAPGSSAPSPHTARSGGGLWLASVRNSSTLRRATVRSSCTGDVPAGARTSTWTAAMVTGSPVAAGSGINAGPNTAATATATSAIRGHPPLPRRAIEDATAAFTRTTTNVTPQTPVTDARRTRLRSSTCDVPRFAQLNPPNGHIARSQSIAVQAAAIPRVLQIGRSRRTIKVARAANAAIDAADMRTSAPHASAPNRKIQYKVAPNIPIPKHKPSTAPRPIVRSRSSTNNGATPTNAIGHAPTGGNAREVARPAASAPAHPRPSDGRGRGFTSRAVAAEHLLLIRELAPVLHEEAVPAHELGLLHRDDLGVDRLGSVVAGEVERHDLLVLVGRLLDRLGGLLLGKQVLDRLNVLESRLRRDRRVLEVLGRRLGVVFFLARELFFLFSEVFDVLWHVRDRALRPREVWGFPPWQLRILQRVGSNVGDTQPRAKKEDPRDGSHPQRRGAASWARLLGPASPPGRRRTPDGTKPGVRRSSRSRPKV